MAALSSKGSDSFQPGADLRGAKLCDADLSAVDLRDADLRGCNLDGLRLRGADLRGAKLCDADLSAVDLRDADLRGADLRRVSGHGDCPDLTYVQAAGADFRRAELSHAVAVKADFSGADVEWADFDCADLRGASFRDAYLRWGSTYLAIVPAVATVSFRGATLAGADFTGSCLPGAIFAEADMSGVRAEGAVLSGASFRNARLEAANLVGSDLSRADFFRTRLVDADLTDASLMEARLVKTICDGASFAGALLCGTTFCDAAIDRTIIGGAKILGSCAWDGKNPEWGVDDANSNAIASANASPFPAWPLIVAHDKSVEWVALRVAETLAAGSLRPPAVVVSRRRDGPNGRRFLASVAPWITIRIDVYPAPPHRAEALILPRDPSNPPTPPGTDRHRWIHTGDGGWQNEFRDIMTRHLGGHSSFSQMRGPD